MVRFSKFSRIPGSGASGIEMELNDRLFTENEWHIVNNNAINSMIVVDLYAVGY